MRRSIFLVLILVLSGCTLGERPPKQHVSAPVGSNATNPPHPTNPSGPAPTNVPNPAPGAAAGSTHRPSIASISVCSPSGAGGQGSCPSGSLDTQQIVLAPDGSGNSINRYEGLNGITDEHSSVFSPGMLGTNRDYLFVVAAGTSLNKDMAAVVLSGGSGPNDKGQWTFNIPNADGYGAYPDGFGQVFNSPIEQGHCPIVKDGNPTHQDQTFDLGYAAPGSVVIDPTGKPGSLLMIYESVNTCVGSNGGRRSGTGAYITAAIATSLDNGHTWPTYRGTSTFNFVPLPKANDTQGPNAPSGAFGGSVCQGNDCSKTSPAAYGRYPVLGLPVPLATLMTAAKPLDGKPGDAEPSAFVDDIGGNNAPYLYIVHGYGPGVAGPALPDGRKDDLTLARAPLNGESAPLHFLKWNGAGFSEPGMSGAETPILPDGPFESCGDLSQHRSSASISYVEPTQQYLLTFVCDSQGNPAGGKAGGKFGSAWFYSTSTSLADPRQWTRPQEIVGSWSEWDNSDGCPDYKGWYPTFMSLGTRPGHLSTSGYVFYLWGCLGGAGDNVPPKRQYAARAFVITIH